MRTIKKRYSRAQAKKVTASFDGGGSCFVYVLNYLLRGNWTPTHLDSLKNVSKMTSYFDPLFDRSKHDNSTQGRGGFLSKILMRLWLVEKRL